MHQRVVMPLDAARLQLAHEVGLSLEGPRHHQQSLVSLCRRCDAGAAVCGYRHRGAAKR